jgi:hypothetical protein
MVVLQLAHRRARLVDDKVKVSWPTGLFPAFISGRDSARLPTGSVG